MPLAGAQLQELNQQYGIVNHNTRQGGKTDDSGHGQADTHQQVAPNDADQCQRDDRHYDQGFDIAAELKAEQNEDTDQADGKTTQQGGTCLAGLPGLTLDAGAHARILAQQVG